MRKLRMMLWQYLFEKSSNKIMWLSCKSEPYYKNKCPVCGSGMGRHRFIELRLQVRGSSLDIGRKYYCKDCYNKLWKRIVDDCLNEIKAEAEMHLGEKQ